MNHDELKGKADSKTRYSILGGKGTYTEPDARDFKLKKNFNSGTLLAVKEFDHSDQYDNQWYTFGPFSPLQGEYIANEKSYYFKIIAEGTEGDDGNLYKYSLSSSPDSHIEIQGANAFTFSYTFRLPDQPSRVSHIYPFISEEVVVLHINNFDFDYGGKMFIYSVSKNRHPVLTGGENNWVKSEHLIDQEEKNSTIDIQIVNSGMKNNNIVVYITNEYNQPIPFYTVPIGGPPKYKYKVSLKYINP